MSTTHPTPSAPPAPPHPQRTDLRPLSEVVPVAERLLADAATLLTAIDPESVPPGAATAAAGDAASLASSTHGALVALAELAGVSFDLPARLPAAPVAVGGPGSKT